MGGTSGGGQDKTQRSALSRIRLGSDNPYAYFRIFIGTINGYVLV